MQRRRLQSSMCSSVGAVNYIQKKTPLFTKARQYPTCVSPWFRGLVRPCQATHVGPLRPTLSTCRIIAEGQHSLKEKHSGMKFCLVGFRASVNNVLACVYVCVREKECVRVYADVLENTEILFWSLVVGTKLTPE